MTTLYSLYGRREAGIISDTAYWKATRDTVHLIKRLTRTRTLEGHHGCVNTISWNSSGTKLITGSDDRHLKIYDWSTGMELKSVLTAHQSNIFSAKFLPGSGDIRAVSCAGIGSVEYSEISPSGKYISHPFQCHRSITYQVATTPGDGNEFMTCEEKGYVRLYDLRVKTECSCDGCVKDVLYSFPASVSSIAVHPISPYYVAFGLGDGSVQVLDRRMVNRSQQRSGSGHSTSSHRALHRKYSIGNQVRKITSTQFNQDGSQLLASYSEDYVYIFNSGLFGCGPGETDISKPTYFSHCEYYSPAVPRKRKGWIGVKLKDKDQANTLQGLKSNAKSPSKEPPPLKKLRLRGDWSDTGPEARPEAEGSRSDGLMHHMSRMFARWIDISLSSDERGRDRGNSRDGETGRRRNPQRGQVHGENTRERSGDGRESFNSSTSSDNSFTLFEETREQELEGSSGENVSNSSATFPQLEESELLIGMEQDHSIKEPVKGTEGGDDGASGYDESTSIKLNLMTQSSGEATKNEFTTQSRYSLDGEHHSQRNETEDGGHHNQRYETEDGGHHSQRNETEDGVHHSQRNETEDGVHHSQRSETEDGGCDILPCDGLVGDRNSSLKSNSEDFSPKAENVEGATVLVEKRALNFPVREVPSIKIIEDETDSDDDIDLVSCDGGAKPCDGSCDHHVKSADEDLKACDEDDGLIAEGCIKPFMVYKGHRNARTMIKQANFFGNNWILSGSDCGRMFVWDKWTGEIVNMLQADSHVVNCIQPHPYSYLIATSGIDYNVKLWEPVSKEVCSLEDLTKVIERNNVMLEESRNTITMPSMIFLRVLSYLNRTRRMRGDQEESDQDDSAT